MGLKIAVWNAALPSIFRTSTLIAELPIRCISQCSVYITLQSPEKTEEASVQLWRRKKVGRASWGYKCFSTVLFVVSVWPLQSISVSSHLTHFQEKVDTPDASLLLSFFPSPSAPPSVGLTFMFYLSDRLCGFPRSRSASVHFRFQRIALPYS